ncbi:hypothetical protein MKX01_041452 [Papaver californicum]|nr:hypothetical protein MKX01_041452 [Papaver californicum]
MYIVQGRGMTGALIPGCPETFHSIQQSQRLRERGQQQRSRDQHQKIRQIQQGDIVALPTGVAHWCYNEGETPLVMVVVHDTSNNANQLDRNLRKFQLAGSQQSQTGSAYQQQQQQQQQQQRRGQQDIPTNNIFNGFDVETLAEAFGVSTETARRLQGQNDQRGNMVFVQEGLQVVRPLSGEEEESEEQYRLTNGLEETICSMRLKQNIANPTRADIFSENGGRITSLNSQKLPILNYIQMMAPHWHLNAHSVIYVTRGNARVQVVGNAGRQVFNGQLNQGQILVVPQNFAVVKQAGNEGFEWVAFKTNDNAMMSPLVGKTSALRAMPADVLMNAYQISREEANRLKNNRREETLILTPGLRSQHEIICLRMVFYRYTGLISMMKSSLFSLGLCILILHGCVAQIQQQRGGWRIQQQQPQRRYQAGESQCRIENLNAQEPNRRFESEAGVTELWDQNNEQFNCAGVSVTRQIIQPRGLLLPSFANAPRLMYIVQGRGMTGALIPGFPETYHSIQQSQRLRERGQQQRPRDQHQKIRQIKQGDIVALPTGVAHWCYNEGETPLVMVVVHDTSNNANQLDRNLRQQEIPTNNIFNGFDVETLTEAFGVSTETARQGQNDQRGNIVFVQEGLQVIRPLSGVEEESEEQYRVTNGLVETIRRMRLKRNIANPTRADIYSENGGRITSLNSQKLPIPNYIQMSAERGVIYQNALMAPHWHLNAHSVTQVAKSSMDKSIKDKFWTNFAVVKQAGNEGFEWVAFKTNDNAMMSPLVGKTSALGAMPVDVLMNAYQIQGEEANRLKQNRREETVILSPGSKSQVRLFLKSEKALSN